MNGLVDALNMNYEEAIEAIIDDKKIVPKILEPL